MNLNNSKYYEDALDAHYKYFLNACGPENQTAEIKKIIEEVILNNRGNINPRKTAIALFSYAVKKSNINLFKALLKAGVILNTQEALSIAILHLAARNDQREIVKLLIDAGVEVNAIDYFGKAALHHAIAVENVEMVQLLLSADAFLEPPKFKTNLLVEAVKDPSKIVPVKLMEAREIQQKGIELTSGIVEDDRIERAPALFAPDALVNKPDHCSKTPLHKAVENRHIEIIDPTLLATDVLVNKPDNADEALCVESSKESDL